MRRGRILILLGLILAVGTAAVVFVMLQGATQSCWQHSLPKTRSRCGQRINLTFRTVAMG